MFQATCLVHTGNDVRVKRFRSLIFLIFSVFFRLFQVNYRQQTGSKICQYAQAKRYAFI